MLALQFNLLKNTQAMNKICIISFGNSAEYRLRLDNCGNDPDDIKAEVRDYLDRKFPTLSALNFYDKMTVIPVDEADAPKYAGYREFDDDSVREIEAVLTRDTEDYESLRRLNSNAPWGD